MSKGLHYHSQLISTLTAGQWATSTPAKAYNGSPLSWSELFRKFNKHCQGLQLQLFAQVGEYTRLLALLLGQAPDSMTKYTLELGNECILPEEHRAEVAQAYEVLKGLDSPSDHLNSLLAYYAYALGDPSQCLAYLNKVQDLSNFHVPVPEGISVSSTDHINRAWALTESIRSFCLRGMFHEVLSPQNPLLALESYCATLPLLKIVTNELCPITPHTFPGRVDYASFIQFQELWTWIQRVIWRGVVLSCQCYDLRVQSEQLWSWLNHYNSHSAFWPPGFRAGNRSAVDMLFLRAFVLSKSISEIKTIRGLITSHRTLLTASTTFPRAGERNYNVEDFAEVCVAVWEASGSTVDGTGWVLDILWWATRLTFNSHIIFRHMTRLLYVSGDINLAKRTLKLYVQIVEKAWQAASASADAGGEGDFSTDSGQNYIATLIFGSYMLLKSTSSHMDTTGMEDVREAGRLLHKAVARINALSNVNEVKACLDLALGVYEVVLALKEQDPLRRPERFSAAHGLFKASIENNLSAQAFFNLSLSLSRPGSLYNLDDAIQNASFAVELESKEVRYWHLLGLLLSVKEEWGAAEVALDTGAALDDLPEEGKPDEGMPQEIVDHNNTEIDGLPPPSPHSSLPVYVLEKGAKEIPPSSTLLWPFLATLHPPPSNHEVFEHALQLRMTQVKVAESVQGAEGASEMLRDIFEWVAAKRGVVSDNTRSSTDHSQGRSTADGTARLKSPSEIILGNSQDPDSEKQPSTRLSLSLNRTLSWSNTKDPPAAAPPIMVEPATPERTSFSINSSEKENDREGNLLKTYSVHDRDSSKSKKVQKMFKDRVQQGGARISTISKKIGSGVKVNGIRRSNSTPDFHAALRHIPYQASSIHLRSRRRLSFIRPDSSSAGESTVTDEPPPPPPPPLPQPTQTKWNKSTKTARENKLLSNLWLVSAATFRRLGKIEQAKAAIQEAEVRDEKNPRVWSQLGLYYLALGNNHYQNAIDAFQKALFIDPDHVEATVHLCRMYVSPDSPSSPSTDIDLAAGMLSHLTRGVGWDVPEAWYFLAKAYGLQERKEKERECLNYALELSERRGVREFGDALGFCL